jgi:hypothetical protein
MCPDSNDAIRSESRIEVMLDGQPVGLPPQRRSLAAIRSYLESRALEQQRILCSFSVDGPAVGSTGPLVRVTGQTIELAQMPLQLVETAIQQTAQAHANVQRAVAHVMINEAARGHELWWDLTQGLKQPLLTLSLLPERVCGPANGSASVMQLRRWQLQQLAGIIQEADLACQTDDPTALSDALESRVLPWLEGLQETLALLRFTLQASRGIAYKDDTSEQQARNPGATPEYLQGTMPGPGVA